MSRSVSSPLVLMGVALAVGATPALAHESRLAAASLDVQDEQVSLRYTITLTDLIEIVPGCDANRDGLLSRAEFTQAAPQLATRAASLLELQADGTTLPGRFVGDAFPAARAVALGDDHARVGVVLSYEVQGFESGPAVADRERRVGLSTLEVQGPAQDVFARDAVAGEADVSVHALAVALQERILRPCSGRDAEEKK